jgi:hypothetical protein
MAYNEILMLAMKREEKALKLYNDFTGKICLSSSARKKPNTSWRWRPCMTTTWLS